MKKIIRLGQYGGGFMQTRTIYDGRGICPTLWSGMGKDPPRILVTQPKQCILVATIDKEHYRITEMHRRVYSASGISPTVNAHHNSPLILVVDDDPD